MTDFMINTPSHKRWMLPDGVHCINSVIYGDECRMSVIVAHTLQGRESFTVKLNNSNWQDLCDGFVELAKKKYPMQLRHKNNMRRDAILTKAEVRRQRAYHRQDRNTRWQMFK